jgi:putative hydrolases of HD superfamily
LQNKKEGKERMKNFKKIINFLFEITYLKRLRRSGWFLLGIEKADSVAEHCFVTAQIAYLLAKMEKANAEHAAVIALFHDNGETRITDLNLVQGYYLKPGKAERRAFFDQVKSLPSAEDIKKLFKEFAESVTPEAIIAKDADRLELAIQAKCYLDAGGNKSLQIWIKRVRVLLKTRSANRLLDAIEESDMNGWWETVKGIREERKKVECALDGSA